MAEAARPVGLRLSEIDEIDVRVEKLVTGGEGLARFEGIPIFVPRSAPGDRLRVRLVERRPDYGRAEVVEVLEPGDGRREPPCPHFSDCGGCDLQHLEDAVQLRAKAEAVRETLRRIGGIEMPAKVAMVASQPFGYRLRTQLQVGDDERGRRIGYHARGSHRLVPVDRCPILVPELEELLPRLPRALRECRHQRLDLAAGDEGAWTSAPMVDGLRQGEVATTVGEHTYRYDARCFFQAHRQLLPALVEHAVGDDEGGGSAFDLYAGVGLFSLPLASRYNKVVAVEGDRVAARFARKNARCAGAANVTVVGRSINSWIDELPAGADRVVVDPPRAGLAPTVRGRLLERRPKRLTYVSCHAATLARDLKTLRRGYRLDAVALLDLFPQTGHMETVAQLVAEEPS